MKVTITLGVDDSVPENERGFHIRNALCQLLSCTSPKYPKDPSLPAHCTARRKGVATQIAVEEVKSCQ